MEFSPQEVIGIIARGGVMPIVRLPSLEKLDQLAAAMLAGGVTAFEITLTCPGAIPALRTLLDQFPEFSDGRAVAGIGTAVTADEAAEAIGAGAQFIVSPVADPQLIEVCVKRNIAVMPGALTPQEIQTAWAAGATVVKVFPTHVFGPVYLKDLLAPLPHLKLMPTGGVSLENVADYIRAGAIAVGAGGNLVDAKRIAAGDWDELTATARAFVEAIQRARSGQ